MTVMTETELQEQEYCRKYIAWQEQLSDYAEWLIDKELKCGHALTEGLTNWATNRALEQFPQPEKQEEDSP